MNLDWVDGLIEEWGLLDVLSRESLGSAALGWWVGGVEVGLQSEPDVGVIRNLQTRQLILSQKTRDRLKGDLKMALVNGVQNGEGVHDLTQRVNAVFDDMKHYELERIARTEVITSANLARQEAWRGNPVVKAKMWLAYMDDRTADDSKRMHGQIQPVDQPFVDWKTGQEVQQPPLRPNDRCTSIPLTKVPNDIVEWYGLRYSNKYLIRTAK